MRTNLFRPMIAALALCAAQATAQSVVTTLGTGTDARAVAVDPVTNRAFVTNEFSDTVTVINGATNATTTVAVGRRPQYVAVNPAKQRIYVANSTDASLSVIDGATLGVGTIPVNGSGPIYVDDPANRVYMIRLGVADEVTFIDATTHAFYTIATNSYAPVGLAIDKPSNRMYVAHYTTGDVRAIDLNSSSDHPPTTSIGVWSRPVAIGINPQTRKVYVATEDSRGPVAVIDAATNAARFITRPGGQGAGPRALVVNPANNRVYVAFNGEVAVIDGGSNAVSYIAVPTPVALALDPRTNRVYAPSASGVLSVIDGATNAVTSVAIPAGAKAIALNPDGNRGYVAGGGGVTIIDLAGAASPPPPPVVEGHNVQGLWWGSPAGSESGWGINLAHQGNVVFATWFTYALDGSPMWLVMSEGARTAANTYSGTLYRTSGPPSTGPFDPSRVVRTPVGAGTFTFSDANNGTFTATVDGIGVTKAITRQVYSSPQPTCEANGPAGPLAIFQDLWWKAPAGSESGWGVNLAHQGSILFVTWFTYGPDGKATWLVGSNVDIIGSNTYQGQLFRPSGPPFNSAPWNRSQVILVPVGTVRFSFADRASGTMSWTVDGATGSKAITRQVFASPPTVCR